MRAWRLLRPQTFWHGMGCWLLSVQHLSPSCCPGCPSTGCHLAWLVCVALLSGDSLGKVWRGFCAQETPLSVSAPLPGPGVKMRAEGPAPGPHPSHRHPGLPDTWRVCAGTYRDASLLHSPGPTVWGAAWVGLGGGHVYVGLGKRREGGGERGAPSLLSEKVTARRPAAHPPTHVRMYIHDTVCGDACAQMGPDTDNCTEPCPAAPLSRLSLRTRH